jgi:hypothetical protein
MAQQLCWIHADRDQSRQGKEYAGRSQPALDPASFTRIGRDAKSPGFSVSLNTRTQSIPSPQASGALPIEMKEVYQQTAAQNEYPASYPRILRLEWT